MKTWLILGLAVLAFALALAWPPDDPRAPSGAAPPAGPSFEVLVVKPRSARPLFGILPDGIFGLPPSVLRFDHASPGAEAVVVEPGRLEFRAEGWHLRVEIDGDGGIAPGTRLMFPLELAERDLTLCCRPADRAAGHLRTTPRSGSDQLDGDFLIQLATCENAATGKVIEWPPSALTVRGRFAGLPRGRR